MRVSGGYLGPSYTSLIELFTTIVNAVYLTFNYFRRNIYHRCLTGS